MCDIFRFGGTNECTFPLSTPWLGFTPQRFLSLDMSRRCPARKERVQMRVASSTLTKYCTVNNQKMTARRSQIIENE